MMDRKTDSIHMNRQRRIAVSVCAVLIFLILLSTAYEIKEYNHECTGSDCIICFQMEQCAVSLVKISSGSDSCTSFCISVFFAVACMIFFSFCFCRESLVEWNIRLNE